MSYFLYEATTRHVELTERDGVTHVLSKEPLDARIGWFDATRDEPHGHYISLQFEETFTVSVPFNNVIPVYYTMDPIVVGTSLRQVAERAGKTEVSSEAASQMRFVGHVFGRNTRIQGVMRLAAGERLTVKDGDVTIEKWDDLPMGTNTLREDFDATWIKALRQSIPPYQTVNLPFAGSAFDLVFTKLTLEAGKKVRLHVPSLDGNEADLARQLFEEAELVEAEPPVTDLHLSLSKRVAQSFDVTEGNLSAYESIPTGRARDTDYVEIGKHGSDWLYGKHIFLKETMDEHEAKQQLSRRAIRPFEGFGEAEREQVEAMLERLFDTYEDRDWSGRLEAAWFELKVEHFHAYARQGFMNEMLLVQPLFDRDVLRHILEAPYELKRQGHLMKVAFDELFGPTPPHLVKESFAWSDSPLLPTVTPAPLNWRLMLDAVVPSQVERMHELLRVEDSVHQAMPKGDKPNHQVVSIWNDWTAQNWSHLLEETAIEEEQVELEIPEAHQPRSVTIKPFIYHYFVPFNTELFSLRENQFKAEVDVEPLHGENGYIQLFNQSFSSPPSSEFLKDATLGNAPFIHVSGTIELLSDEDTSIELYIMQYDAKKNLKKAAFGQTLRTGVNTLQQRVPKELDAKYVKLAIKFQNDQHAVRLRMGAWDIES